MNVIMVVLDGLNYQTATQTLGHLQAYCDARLGRLYAVRCELPALSRPLYECLLTGVKPLDSGIVNNRITRQSKEQSVFHYARLAGLTTAAAAYHWVSELYNQSPFSPARDRHTQNRALAIQYGHFYYQDDYPDSHLFADAESLRRRHQPHFLLIHSMNIDDIGHQHGQNSQAYRNAARRADNLLSDYLPGWLADGYQVIVTADHGMNDDGDHCCGSDAETLVPLYVLGEGFSLDDAQVKQTDICGTVCQLLGVTHDKPYCAALLKGG